MVTVRISQPVFRCAEEQAVFRERLTRISGQQRIEHADGAYRLSLQPPTAQVLRDELGQLCEQWGCRFDIETRD